MTRSWRCCLGPEQEGSEPRRNLFMEHVHQVVCPGFHRSLQFLSIDSIGRSAFVRYFDPFNALKHHPQEVLGLCRARMGRAWGFGAGKTLITYQQQESAQTNACSHPTPLLCLPNSKSRQTDLLGQVREIVARRSFAGG